jgi:hypothetical protein
MTFYYALKLFVNIEKMYRTVYLKKRHQIFLISKLSLKNLLRSYLNYLKKIVDHSSIYSQK